MVTPIVSHETRLYASRFGLPVATRLERGRRSLVVLSNLALRDWGVPPREKSRALAELEELRLITTERCKGKSPRITLLIEPGPAEFDGDLERRVPDF